MSVPPPVWKPNAVKLPTLIQKEMKTPSIDVMNTVDKSILAPDFMGKTIALFLPSLNSSQGPMLCHLRIIKIHRPYKPKNMLRVRREKMNKHRLKKFRKKYMALLKKIKTKREVKKEKELRAELLSQIREAENFDAEIYVKNVLSTIDRKPAKETLHERRERYNRLREVHRSNTSLTRPNFDDPVP